MPCCRPTAPAEPGPWRGAGQPLPYRETCCCSRLLFTWFTPLITAGARGPLTEADSWTSPDPDKCSVLAADLARHLARVTARRGGGRWSLLRALVSVRWRAFCLCALLKLTAESLDFAGPLLLGLLLQFVQNPELYAPETPFIVAGAMVGYFFMEPGHCDALSHPHARRLVLPCPRSPLTIQRHPLYIEDH